MANSPLSEQWSERVHSTAQGLAARSKRKSQPIPVSSNDVNRAKPCEFCGEHSYANTCQQYSTLEQRTARIQELNLCWICLKAGHNSRNCRHSSVQCYYCHKTGHHQAVCFQKFGRPNQSGNSRTNFSESQEPEENGENPQETQSTVGVVSNSVITEGRMVRKEKQSFFQIARTYALGAEVSDQANLLLDSGSNRSYITEELANKLKLPTLYDETLTIHRLNSSAEPQTVKSRVVDFSVRKWIYDELVFSVPIRANVLPNLVTPIPQIPVKALIDEHVKKTQSLAIPPNSKFCWLNIDVLVGMTHYEQIVTGANQALGDSGLFVRDSKLGKLISGCIEVPEGQSIAAPVSLVSVSHKVALPSSLQPLCGEASGVKHLLTSEISADVSIFLSGGESCRRSVNQDGKTGPSSASQDEE